MIHEPRVARLRASTGEYIDAQGRVDVVSNMRLSDGGEVFFDVPERRNMRLDIMSCWVLPALGVRICCWTLASGEVSLPTDFDWFIDSCESTWVDETLVMKDRYIDVQAWNSGECKVVDVDEMLEALVAGHISVREAQLAVESCISASLQLQGIKADARRRALNEQIHTTGH